MIVKHKLSVTYRQTLTCFKRIVGKKHQTTAAKVSAELNQHTNSPVSPKLFALSFIKLDVMEEPPSRNLYFLLSTFRRGWSGLEIARDGLQSSFSLFPTAGQVYVWKAEGSPEKLTTLTAFFPQWSKEVDQWWFGKPYLGILSVRSLPCMVGATTRITWHFRRSCSSNGSGIIPWWWLHLPRQQWNDAYCLCG